MVKQNIKKGYLISDLLVTLIIITSIFASLIPLFKDINYDYLIFQDYYTYNQSYSMANKTNIDMDMNFKEILYYTNIVFNEKGNVNQAQTIKFNNSIYVVELGAGRLVKK